MNLGLFLTSKGYQYRTVMFNGAFNLIVTKEDKQILKISAPPRVPVATQQEFDIRLFETVKQQIEIYEEELRNVTKEREATSSNQDNGCQEVCISAEESQQVSQLNCVSGQG